MAAYLPSGWPAIPRNVGTLPVYRILRAWMIAAADSPVTVPVLNVVVPPVEAAVAYR